MVAETAVEDFKLCLRSFKFSEEKMAEQQNLLGKIVAIKPDGASPEAAKLIGLLDTITESLLKLTFSVAEASREQKLKCEEEVANANSMLVKGGIGGSPSIGKERLSRVVGIGKFKETNFREWRHTLMTTL